MMSDDTTAIFFNILVDGQEVLVRYQADWLSLPELGCRYARLEFRSPHTPPRRIPLAREGSVGRFVPMADVEAFRCPQEYACELAAWLMRSGGQPTDEDDDNEQLSLL
jgi:hypothetical protein